MEITLFLCFGVLPARSGWSVASIVGWKQVLVCVLLEYLLGFEMQASIHCGNTY